MTNQKHRIPHKDWHIGQMKKYKFNQESLLAAYPDKPFIVGTDEVGTGSIFGPLGVGVCVLSRDSTVAVKDSKAYTTDKARVSAYARVIADMKYGRVELSSAHAIDKYGLSKAKDYITFEIFEEVVSLYDPEEIVIVMDGAYIPKHLPSFLNGYDIIAVPKADATIKAVSAASVLAKVEKDDFIVELVKGNPDLERYDIATNRGYSTPKHIAALKQYGVSEYHRITFSVCKNLQREG